MIFAHHAGEEAILAALASGGTTAVTGALLVVRARLAGLVRWLRRR